VLNRFDALPAGRRAIVLISDGLDISNGIGESSPTQSVALDRAILAAQRRSTAVFAIYSPTEITERAGSQAVLNGQSSLLRLATETGGRAFFQGNIAPISFVPFFKDLSLLLNRQYLLTYLSTNMKRGYHRLEVRSTNPDVRIEYPKGYYY
jgi:VWFA-related protein